MAKLDLKRSVLLTIAYSGVFSFPLTLAEIKLRLFRFTNISSRQLVASLSQLVKEKKVRHRAGYFAVGQPPAIAFRREKENYSRQKLLEAQNLIRVARLLPWVKALAVSGSTAVKNAKKTDDVDWLVITADHSLWLVRPWLLLVAGIFGKRRERNGHHRDNSWCFNLFLSESELALPDFKRSVYSAYEVCQAQFLYATPGIEKLFLTANHWAETFLPTYFSERLSKVGEGSRPISGHNPALLRFLNRWLYKLQYAYMKPHITRELVAEGFAYFHPRDTKKTLYRRWSKLANSSYEK